uniref:(northern house mosquito) hypothetical protein n=1 Tax=Culex pipiens TaxID=7175 RepID=A0A8D8CGB1_CULPI
MLRDHGGSSGRCRFGDTVFVPAFQIDAVGVVPDHLSVCRRALPDASAWCGHWNIQLHWRTGTDCDSVYHLFGQRKPRPPTGHHGLRFGRRRFHRPAAAGNAAPPPAANPRRGRTVRRRLDLRRLLPLRPVEEIPRRLVRKPVARTVGRGARAERRHARQPGVRTDHLDGEDTAGDRPDTAAVDEAAGAPGQHHGHPEDGGRGHAADVLVLRVRGIFRGRK